MIERAVDRHNQEILAQVVSYTICAFTPRQKRIREEGLASMDDAIERGVELLRQNPSTRTVMLYAADHHERHVMVGFLDRALRFHPARN